MLNRRILTGVASHIFLNCMIRKLSLAQKQNYLYTGFILFTVLVSMISYRVTQKKWLFFRQAENKFSEQAFREAIVLYHASLQEGPTTAKAFLHLADSYATEGNFSKSIDYYRAYLKTHPQDTHVRLLLARALSWNGNIQEAEKEYQQLLNDSHEKKEND